MAADPPGGPHPPHASPGQGDVEWAAAEVAALVAAEGLPLARGEPTAFFRRLARLDAALTLPIVLPSRARDALLLKLLYSLWNIVVDDQIDRAGDASGIDASVAFLSGLAPEERTRRAPAWILLRRMAELVPGGRISRLDALGFDLWEVVNGLCYEHFINESPSRATAAEYRRYSTMTASTKVLLDIDLAFAERPLEPLAYRTLREAYEEATCALKLASDVGTVQREIRDEDSMSLLRILAGPPHAAADGRPKEALIAEALRHKEAVLELSREHWARARALFDAVPQVDTSGVARALSRLIEVYSGGTDPFFD